MEAASPDLRHRLRESAHRTGLAAFWRWWTAQLAPLVPPSVRNAMLRRRLRNVVVFGPAAAFVWQPKVENGSLRYVESARIELEGDAAAVAKSGRAALAQLPRNGIAGAYTHDVVIALESGRVLRKRLRLPAALAENVKQALAYDLDRHTPFRADELYFDAAIVERNPSKREIVVDWAAARRTDVDGARRTAESFGANVVGVAADAPGADADAAQIGRLNLLPDAERADAGATHRWALWIPLAATLAVAMVALVLPIWQKRDYVRALLAQVEQARTQAMQADALRTQLDQHIADYNFVLAKKFGYPSSVQTLDDVTKLLPDDTWLTQFEVKSVVRNKEAQRELLLRGESANGGRLVSLLEESKLFEQAAPRSPTTKIQPGPGEIFDIGAIVKPLAVPAAIPVAENVAASAPAQPGPAAAAATPAAPASPAVAAAPPERPLSPASAAASAPAAAAPSHAPAVAASTAAAPPAMAPPRPAYVPPPSASGQDPLWEATSAARPPEGVGDRAVRAGGARAEPAQ